GQLVALAPRAPEAPVIAAGPAAPVPRTEPVRSADAGSATPPLIIISGIDAPRPDNGIRGTLPAPSAPAPRVSRPVSVFVSRKTAREERRRRARAQAKVDATNPPAPANPNFAVDALSRINIPKEAAERISELLTPGSSLIVSDQGVSQETGQDTDFIILTR